jgi:hypothetical protein
MWNTWGYMEMPVTATGHRFNQHTVGPALLWSPFFLLAHLYVKAAGGFGRPLRMAATRTPIVAVDRVR